MVLQSVRYYCRLSYFAFEFVGQYFGDKKKRLCRHDIVSNMMYGLGVIISQLL